MSVWYINDSCYSALMLLKRLSEMSHPTSHTMKAAIDAANDNDEDEPPRKKATPGKCQTVWPVDDLTCQIDDLSNYFIN